MITSIEGKQLIKWINFTYKEDKALNLLPDGTIKFKVNNVEWFEYDTNDTFYIIIPGTIDIEDVKDDFKFKLINDTNIFNNKIKFHKGFYEQARIIYYSLITRLPKILFHKEKNRIVVCGHSLGGAIAQILSLLIYTPKFNIETFTIGSPRVFNFYGKKFYNRIVKSSVRVVNGNDLVTFLPFKFLNYFHTKNKVHIGNSNLFKKFLTFCNWSTNAWFDHNPRYYLQNWNKKFNL